jgi:hypothetical protein
LTIGPAAPGCDRFQAVRGLSSGGARDYTGVEFTLGWSGADQFRRQLCAFGYVRNSSAEPSYGVLDVLDAHGDIVQDYDVPTANAFAYIKRKLRLRVESDDAAMSRMSQIDGYSVLLSQSPQDVTTKAKHWRATQLVAASEALEMALLRCNPTKGGVPWPGRSRSSVSVPRRHRCASSTSGVTGSART